MFQNYSFWKHFKCMLITNILFIGDTQLGQEDKFNMLNTSSFPKIYTNIWKVLNIGSRFSDFYPKKCCNSRFFLQKLIIFSNLSSPRGAYAIPLGLSITRLLSSIVCHTSFVLTKFQDITYKYTAKSVLMVAPVHLQSFLLNFYRWSKFSIYIATTVIIIIILIVKVAIYIIFI